MSTDTAFALGALALAGPGVPDRVRTYLLTFALADGVAGIVVIRAGLQRPHRLGGFRVGTMTGYAAIYWLTNFSRACSAIIQNPSAGSSCASISACSIASRSCRASIRAR